MPKTRRILLYGGGFGMLDTCDKLPFDHGLGSADRLYNYQKPFQPLFELVRGQTIMHDCLASLF